jgi:ligand-binding sensor domain-containing protein
LSSNVVRSTVECKDGTLWVATTAGVDSIDRKIHKVTRHAAFDMGRSVWSRFIEDHAGGLWFAYGEAYENEVAQRPGRRYSRIIVSFPRRKGFRRRQGHV